MTVDLAEAINNVLLEIEVIQNRLNALRDDAMAALHALTPADPTGKRLTVPCLAMLVNYRGESVVKVDDVSRAAGKLHGYSTLSFVDIISAAAKYKITLQHGNASLETICADIDVGHPVIVLVNYRSLPMDSRYDSSYNAGHYLLVVGYDMRAKKIIYHDPYWLDIAKGAYKTISRDDFMRAYTTIAPGNSYSAHALRIA